MADDSDDKSPISVEIGLKAEAKLEVRTEIPSESSGRLVDALTDIIRPFSEKRGLKADRLRLQRESVLIEIAQIARQRAAIENIELHPLPTKFLVNFLEKASLEDDSSELKMKWADLLINASVHYEDKFTVFADVLSSLAAQEAQLLDRIAPRVRYTRDYLYKDIQREAGYRTYVSFILDGIADYDWVRLSNKLILHSAQRERFNRLEEEAKKWHGEYETIETLSPDHEFFLKLAATAPDFSANLLSMSLKRASGSRLKLRSQEEIDNTTELANLQRNMLVTVETITATNQSGTFQLEWFELTPFGRLFVGACSGRASNETPVTV